MYEETTGDKVEFHTIITVSMRSSSIYPIYVIGLFTYVKPNGNPRKMSEIMSSVLTSLETNNINRVNRARSHMDGDYNIYVFESV